MEKEGSCNKKTPLRNRAEKTLERRKYYVPETADDETRRLIHELNIHKVELELQNEELRKSREVAGERTAELARNSARFEAIFNSITDGLIFVDIQRRILLTNPAVTAIFGYRADELVGKSAEIFYADKAGYEEQGRLRYSLEHPTLPDVCEMRYRRKDGSIFLGESLVVQVRDSGGNIIGFVGIHRDITERKKMEEARERNLSRLSTLLRASESVLSSGTVEDLLRYIVDYGRNLVDAGLGAAGYGYTENVFRLCVAERPEVPAKFVPETFAVEKPGVYIEILGKGSVRLAEQELHDHPKWWGLPEGHPPLRGLLGASILGQNGKARGLIMVSDKKQGDFTEEDEILLRQLASIASLGLQHIEARSEVEKRADELDTIFLSLIAPVITYYKEGVTIKANPAAIDALGFDPASLGKMETEALIVRLNIRDADSRPISADDLPWKRALNGEVLNREPYFYTNAKGEDVIVHLSAAPLCAKGVISGTVVAWHDVTELERTKEELQRSQNALEKKVHERTLDLAMANAELKAEINHRRKAEEELISSQQKLRCLYAHLQSMREEERTNIAREIHDELGQIMTALKMDLSWIKNRMPTELDALIERTNANVELVDRTIQTIKRIITELRPGILDHLGLGAAIEWQAGEFQKRTGIACNVTVEPPDIVVEPSLSIALFRIFQEALTNVARHAQAASVRVVLRQDAGKIKLEVADDGIGITADNISKSKNFGLQGMRERVYQFDGDIRIKGKPGLGTVITVSIPLTGSLYDR